MQLEDYGVIYKVHEKGDIIKILHSYSDLNNEHLNSLRGRSVQVCYNDKTWIYISQDYWNTNVINITANHENKKIQVESDYKGNLFYLIKDAVYKSVHSFEEYWERQLVIADKVKESIQCS